jgi:hypothetical protein
MRSVPPRGSGWVALATLMGLQQELLLAGPTRYREVVLTSWDHA